MGTVISPGHGKTAGRITVAAAEKAGVIHADIAAHDAAALPALGGVFSAGNVYLEQFCQQPIINAFPGLHSHRSQIELFGTAQELDTTRSGNVDQFRNQRGHLSKADISRMPQGNSISVEFSQATCRLPVEIDEADEATVGIPGEFVGEYGEIVYMIGS